MSTFLLNENNDFALVRGQLVLERDEVVAEGIDLFQKFQLFLGEWFLDTRQGVPYLQVVYVKNPDIELIKRMYTSILLSSPLVRDVYKMDAFYLPAQRMAAFEFGAKMSDGSDLVGGSHKPFIVSNSEAN